MKKVFLLTIVSLLMMIATSCSNNRQSQIPDVGQAATAGYFTCGMHPEVHSDKPGNCPECGMQLIKKEGPKPDSTSVNQVTDSAKMK